MTAWVYRGEVVIAKNVCIQHPVVYQGRGKLLIGNNVSLGFNLAGSLGNPILLQPREQNAEIILGENCAIMNGCELIACKTITIGKNTLIGPSTIIYDSDFHGVSPEQRNTPGKSAPVVIEENVWIGARTIILKGVHIGANAVIAAGCVVSNNVPAGMIVAGNPMSVVGSVNQSGRQKTNE
ncbi:MAG: acyltransferase [Anaerolineaceae bacterium]